MSTPVPTESVSPDTRVGGVVERIPEAMKLFHEYQAGTEGLCVITREDSLRELADRFKVSIETVVDDLGQYCAEDQ